MEDRNRDARDQLLERGEGTLQFGTTEPWLDEAYEQLLDGPPGRQSLDAVLGRLLEEVDRANWGTLRRFANEAAIPRRPPRKYAVVVKIEDRAVIGGNARSERLRNAGHRRLSGSTMPYENQCLVIDYRSGGVNDKRPPPAENPYD